MTIREASDTIKTTLTAREVAERYGQTPNREGYIVCPFHGDTDPSLLLYKGHRGWYCYGCHRGGSVVDLVMGFEGCGFTQAVRILDDLFDLHLLGGPVSLDAMLRRKSEQLALDAIRENALAAWSAVSRATDTEISCLWHEYVDLCSIPRHQSSDEQTIRREELKDELMRLEDKQKEISERKEVIKGWRLSAARA
jgi:hypothetical protein